MERKEKPRSLRTFVPAVIGTAVLCCVVVFVCIFLGNMLRMLQGAERTHLSELSDVMHGVIDATMENLHSSARTWASWDDAYNYATGSNDGFVEVNLADGTLLASSGADFVVIKDRVGNDLYVGFRSTSLGSAEFLPGRLGDRLAEIAAEVLRKQDPNLFSAGDRYFDAGFLADDGKFWLFCVMPILHSNETGEAAGTFALVAAYDDMRLRKLTRLASTRFGIREQDPAHPLSDDVYELDDGDFITMHMLLRDLGSDRSVVLELKHPRVLYVNGWSLVLWTTLVLSLALLAIMAGLFCILERYLLRPLVKLSSDIGKIDRDAPFDPREYEGHEEFYTLSHAISDMLERLHQSHQAEARSRISLSVLENILNGMDSLIYVSDPDTDEILFINDRMRTHFDIEGSGVGEPCWKLLQSGFDRRCDFCPSPELLQDPRNVIVWEEHNTRTGRYYRNTDRLIDWTAGRKGHLQQSVDITDVRLAEINLQERLDQQALMAAISQNFISAKNVHALVARALKMTGEFMGIQRILLVRYDDETRSLECLNEWCDPAGNIPSRIGCVLPVAESDLRPGGMFGGMFDGKTPYITSGGEDAERPVEARYFPEIPNYLTLPIFVGGELWGILDLGQSEDGRKWTQSDVELAKLVSSLLSGVINRQRMEEQLHRLSSIVKSSPQFIFYITLDGRMDYVNPAASVITGYTKKELMEGGLDLIWSPETAHRIREEYIPEILKHGEANFEMELIRKDGERRIMGVSCFTASAGADQVNIGGIARDITEMRSLEKELVSAKELAEQGSLAKSEFLSRMSHEMRTPMSAIIGMTSIARASDDPKKKEYCLEKIDNASRHLLGVINDILDMSKIEANKFELSPSEFNFEKMLMNVINVVNFRMEEKSQKLSLYVDPAIPPVLVGDEQRLAQVVANLLTNAVKFTPEKGHIGLSARLIHDESPQETEDGPLTLRIEVDDDGIGISKAQQEKLFRSFEQADGSIARKFGGTGLGLAISKRIVELMGGQIHVESELHAGSKFIFTVKVAKGSGAAPERSVDLGTLNVLAVDDSAETRDYFLHVMRELGVPCRVASGSREALDILERTEKPFDIIFVDWQMPDMNGIELTRELRRRHDSRSIIVMISVAEWSEIEKEATEAGVDGFVPKPLFPSLILDCIDRYLGRSSPVPPASIETPPEEDKRFPGKTVLLAEDVDINREIVITILEGTGLVIDCAVDGLEAVRLFSAAPSRYDIVFMDMHMPEMDGLEATRKIRALDCPEAKRVPIVAMTANVFREDIERCLEAGMNDHIGKPIDFDQLFAKLSKYLNGENPPA